MDEESAAIKHYAYIRPQLVKLFTRFVLLYMSIRAFLDFQGSESTYITFLNTLTEPIIVDAKLVDYTQECEYPFEKISSSYIPPIQSGCRCDYNVYQQSVCDMIYNYTKWEEPFWEKRCEFMDSIIKGQDQSPPAERVLQDVGNQTIEFDYDTKNVIPRNCYCYQNITGDSVNRTIDMWIPNKKICVRRDNLTTTLSYLNSAMVNYDRYNCTSNEDLCQNYFCKNYLPGKNCPIVDIFFDHKTIPDNFKNNSIPIYWSNSSNWNMHATPYYTQSFTTMEYFENLILLPIIDLKITRNGQCTTASTKTALEMPFSLIETQDCPEAQDYSVINQQKFVDLLKINGHYDELMTKFPLLNMTFKDDDKWNLEVETAFYRNSLTCLMINYDEINKNKFFSNSTQIFKNFEYKRKKIGNILKAFIDFSSSYYFQGGIQISILGLNCLSVLITVAIVIYKIILYLRRTTMYHDNITNTEIYFSFFIDFSIAILGGTSYFVIIDYVNFIETLLESGCVDDKIQYQLGSFDQSLQDTAESNLNIFIIVIIKIFLIIFSIIFYAFNSNKLGCSKLEEIIRENINEGEIDPPKDDQQEKSCEIVSIKPKDPDNINTLTYTIKQNENEK